MHCFETHEKPSHKHLTIRKLTPKFALSSEIYVFDRRQFVRKNIFPFLPVVFCPTTNKIYQNLVHVIGFTKSDL